MGQSIKIQGLFRQQLGNSIGLFTLNESTYNKKGNIKKQAFQICRQIPMAYNSACKFWDIGSKLGTQVAAKSHQDSAGKDVNRVCSIELSTCIPLKAGKAKKI